MGSAYPASWRPTLLLVGLDQAFGERCDELVANMAVVVRRERVSDAVAAVVAWQPRAVFVHKPSVDSFVGELARLKCSFRGRIIPIVDQDMAETVLEELLRWVLAGSGLRQKV